MPLVVAAPATVVRMDEGLQLGVLGLVGRWAGGFLLLRRSNLSHCKLWLGRSLGGGHGNHNCRLGRL